jgi:molybdopterin molybdotransferase
MSFEARLAFDGTFEAQLTSIDPRYPFGTSLADAKSLLSTLIEPLAEIEEIKLAHAFKRVLAEPLVSPLNVPAYNNSAMDGFALRYVDLVPDSETSLEIVGTAFAGRRFDGTVAPGQALRIMTGAVLPDELNTVIAQELCTIDGTKIRVPAGQRLGQHCRTAGEDLAINKIALPAGRQLTAADVGLIASLGLASVRVRRVPRIAVFSTGDELLEPGQAAQADRIFDSNRYVLLSLLADLGLSAEDFGIVPDQPEALEQVLSRAAEMDLIISSGGVSVGEADFTRALLNRHGQISFATLAIRPGRPLAFGKLGKAWYFGLPGNPVAVMVTYLFVVRDAVLRLLGAEPQALITVAARATTTIRKRAGRTEYQRGIATLGTEGHLQVELTGQQGSGVLRSMAEANCMIVLDPEQTSVLAGQPVSIILFRGLL